MEPTSIVVAARSALAGILGISPTARQRSQVRRNIDLLKALNEVGADDASTRLSTTIALQVTVLCDRTDAALQRSYGWSTLIVGLIFAAMLAAGGWFLYPLNGWWRWAIFILIVIAGSLILVGTLGAFFQPGLRKRNLG